MRRAQSISTKAAQDKRPSSPFDVPNVASRRRSLSTMNQRLLAQQQNFDALRKNIIEAQVIYQQRNYPLKSTLKYAAVKSIYSVKPLSIHSPLRRVKPPIQLLQRKQMELRDTTRFQDDSYTYTVVKFD